ncbi:MAG: bifunctional diaminohydroxyphosphoribosylaminopyrimidine deaminase/5-amino-6-(5-phosphoribosylamino)uracil reductase RibD [Solirubrobacterales bacterium]
MTPQLTGTDTVHMRRALELAGGGRGRVSPNPLVGAIVVRDGETIGEGFHAELGGLHAERAALEDCRRRGEDPAGATMHVTLEPCAHQGRQPPCTEAIVEAGIARVVIASPDPSEKASGRGPEILREAGIEVVDFEGEETETARRLNQPFRKHARTGKPLVTLKMAMSLDGRTSTAAGDSPWLSGEESRALVHRWRAESDAVAVGIGTVLADDPLLTAREVEASRQPARVVFDRSARLPLDSQLLRSLEQAGVIVIAGQEAEPAAIDRRRDAGADVIVADGITAALAALGSRHITSLFLEGGRALAAAFVAAGEVDEARTFVAPILLGGVDSRPGARGEGGVEDDPPRSAPPPPVMGPARRSALTSRVETIGDDVLITSRFREW